MSAISGTLVLPPVYAIKVMTNCFGEDVYYSWLKRVSSAYKVCHSEDINLPTKGDQGHEEDDILQTVLHEVSSIIWGAVTK